MSSPSWRRRWLPCALVSTCALGLFSLGYFSQTSRLASSVAREEPELLLNPRALQSNSSSATVEQLRASFANPPAEYRSMPLWVWNDEMDPVRLKEQLAQFKQQGMGGVFIHPRPGLMTEYLGTDWFRFWKLSMEEGRRLGLLVNIYDENSYPSGFSGGHVPARAPDTVSQFVQAELDATDRGVNFAEAELVAAFAVTKDDAGAVKSAQRIRSASGHASGQALLSFRLRRASGNPWTGGFPYVDLTNPQTARLFLETTFESYKKQFGSEFGRTVKWSFDDEPLIATGGAYDAAPLALPLSRYSLAEFQKRCHYDLADHLPSLYWDVGDFHKVRFDYWQLLHDLWKENYLRPIFEWCDRNGLQFTGHWMEHEWPYPWISPADASLYAYEHVPGIDMLEGGNIRTRGSDPFMLFTIKQVASVSHQLGRRAFCEAYGVSGWDSTFEHYKRFGDWLMVHGIDFMNQHLAFSTIRGARKRDHPQSFSDVSPWWPFYGLHGDYLGRVSYMLSRGTPQNRLLVLEPTTSGFLWARRSGQNPELEKIREDYSEMVQSLADHQVDFDLADEYILEWFGKQENQRLRVGKASYDLLVWPAGMSNLRHQTLPLLAKYLESGGEVLALSGPSDFVDGRRCEEVKDLTRRYASQWHSVSSLSDLQTQVQQRLKPRVMLDKLLPNVGFSERVLDNGDRILFFANTGLVPAKTRATVEGGGLEDWDPITGKMAVGRFEPAGPGRIRFGLDLPPAGSEMVMVTKARTSPKPLAPPVQFKAIAPDSWRITPDAPNVLVLDYCDLSIAGIEHQDINTWRANWTLWQLHGFDRPAWDNAVQFKTRIFDREPFPADSGFVATFRFQVDDPEALQGMALALETPERYQVSLNGETVSFAQSSRWLDPHLQCTPIEKLVKTGENLVKVAGKPFNVHMELENIYLRGNFAVSASEKGFRLKKPVPLQLGSWAKQGLPFFSGSVVYQTEVVLPKDSDRLQIDLKEWSGSVASVSLDGRQVAVLGWPPYSAEVSAAPGKHAIEVKVVSTPRNIFGPFYNPVKPRMKAWPAAWAEFPEHQPPGSAYDLLDYGLMKPPVISAGVLQKK